MIRPEANKKVEAKFWQNFHHFGMAITVWHELLYGLYYMQSGKRQQGFANFIYRDLETLPKYYYELECADIHAKIRANCAKMGKSLSFADSQIASIALLNNAVLVTRNIDDFKYIDGLKIENWFD